MPQRKHTITMSEVYRIYEQQVEYAQHYLSGCNYSAEGKRRIALKLESMQEMLGAMEAYVYGIRSVFHDTGGTIEIYAKDREVSPRLRGADYDGKSRTITKGKLPS